MAATDTPFSSGSVAGALLEAAAEEAGSFFPLLALLFSAATPVVARSPE
jgi:hypothetical protein